MHRESARARSEDHAHAPGACVRAVDRARHAACAGFHDAPLAIPLLGIAHRERRGPQPRRTAWRFAQPDASETGARFGNTSAVITRRFSSIRRPALAHRGRRGLGPTSQSDFSVPPQNVRNHLGGCVLSTTHHRPSRDWTWPIARAPPPRTGSARGPGAWLGASRRCRQRVPARAPLAAMTRCPPRWMTEEEETQSNPSSPSLNPWTDVFESWRCLHGREASPCRRYYSGTPTHRFSALLRNLPD